MAPLPVVSGREAVKAFGKPGYDVDRQRGSHIILRQTRPPHRRLTIPDLKELRKGTLRAIIRQAGISVGQLQIIGEASKRLSEDLKGSLSEIPWRQVAGMRDKLTHDYMGVDLDTVWRPRLLRGWSHCVSQR